jgi:hypothetical protein
MSTLQARIDSNKACPRWLGPALRGNVKILDEIGMGSLFNLL